MKKKPEMRWFIDLIFTSYLSHDVYIKIVLQIQASASPLDLIGRFVLLFPPRGK